HELPSQQELMAGLTAFSHTVLAPQTLPGVLDRAFVTFTCARPRPVHIELPLDVITADAASVGRQARAFATPPAPHPEAISAAGTRLRQARRPLVVLGGGCQNAAPAALAFVEKLGAPTVTTTNGKGLLPPGHPLSLGSSLGREPVHEELAQADVVLAVGTELGETDTWLFGSRPKLEGKLIRVDIEPAPRGRNATPEIAVLSDAGTALSALERSFPKRASNAGASRVEVLRRRLQDGLTEKQRQHIRLLAAVQQALPGLILVGDSTQPVYSGN